MKPENYLLFSFLLLLAAYVIFRRLIRRVYLEKGRLTWLSTSLQLVIFGGVIAFPYLFYPPEWPWFWRVEGYAEPGLRISGMIVIVLGFVVAIGTMIWFGLKRALGFEAKGLVRKGLYRFTRNPQILGGYLLVGGTVLQQPSWYGVGWILLYGWVGHWMIRTEEEHLRSRFGEEYERYCADTPRYLFTLKKTRRQTF
ncbi:MAG: isoprenylcysteine carboxylmethyltransferase family protein [Chloroflexi bacterium]|nr:isoprenylcysteine carboxylmethyltransferase family protein [Chloroflexota bacterium]